MKIEKRYKWYEIVNRNMLPLYEYAHVSGKYVFIRDEYSSEEEAIEDFILILDQYQNHRNFTLITLYSVVE